MTYEDGFNPDGFYCDDCTDFHENVDDCPMTVYPCPECKELSVRVESGPAPDDPPEAFCEDCGWESPA
ncbi:hypothetical protein ACIRSS_50170 [Amycolatopsis sp. NPDC101161]|uniref:hypothetical protein n=1 Tax=Amycolatopsis sp. NPDC101161 TaxID=3363940 RepID=UPI0038028AFB